MHVVVAAVSASNPIAGQRLSSVQRHRVVAIAQHSVVVAVVVIVVVADSTGTYSDANAANSCAVHAHVVVHVQVVVGLVIQQSIAG